MTAGCHTGARSCFYQRPRAGRDAPPGAARDRPRLRWSECRRHFDRALASAPRRCAASRRRVETRPRRPSSHSTGMCGAAPVMRCITSGDGVVEPAGRTSAVLTLAAEISTTSRRARAMLRTVSTLATGCRRGCHRRRITTAPTRRSGELAPATCWTVAVGEIERPRRHCPEELASRSSASPRRWRPPVVARVSADVPGGSGSLRRRGTPCAFPRPRPLAPARLRGGGVRTFGRKSSSTIDRLAYRGGRHFAPRRRFSGAGVGGKVRSRRGGRLRGASQAMAMPPRRSFGSDG